MLGFLPNSLSLLRLGLGFWFPFVPASWRIWVVILAAITDAIDGWLARKLGTDGRTGKYLDPVADKVFVLAVLLVLLREELVSPTALALLATRDLVVIFGSIGLVAAGRRDVFARLGPSILGKVTTAGQLAYLLLLIWSREPFLPVFVIVAVVSTLASIDYCRRGWRATRTYADA